ncbi:EthD family reductase [Alicyclobacillus sp. SO9]|uniref:EthD family reductase n=1 Tax=Alicyclobacillus sp. SO9 TaxID=2665646 RepID=UPI0018E7DD32|nr:EthD family reductase [Alicyclobacillus sp. SO9]QQE76874.1 EthD family reductase [Alicyclobacillus sp. SO9]
MYKLVALYRQPEDKKAFDEHYESVHTPLVKKIPGLVKLEVTKIDGDAMGKASKFYLLAEMYFEDEESFQKAMTSPENRATGKDLMSFAGDIVQLMTGEASVE